ncbi:DUF2304 domain-containing protein [Nakamurella antarctica]|uniref:DUF2304 domain-containing protein n=1 Tax=Nakamurella antarctica TaxID=1902245 RepID=A0A3G8ZNY7_9ACTN|nr:DUF2304 domain-containing protein [Nakamurella antarctica]AZI58517.1 DUF2304 domain-containing protein [Nakamurella antarctica]
MNVAYFIALAVCLTLLVCLFLLLRGRRLRERYAALWIVLAFAICIVGAFPDVVSWLSNLVGVQTPANLLFSAAAIVLLLVCLQLSAELTSNEDKVRTLTEEVAILKLQVWEILDTPPLPLPPNEETAIQDLQSSTSD